MRCCHLNSIRDPFDCRPMNDDVADEDVSVCCYLVITNRLSSSVVVVVDCDVVAEDTTQQSYVEVFYLLKSVLLERKTTSISNYN